MKKLRAAIEDVPSSKPRKGVFGPSIDMADIVERLDEFDDEGAVLKASKYDLGRSVRTPEYEAYFNKAVEIYEFFKLIKQKNRELGNTLISKAIFDDPKFQKYYGVFNITQALGTADGEIIDGVRPFAVRTFLDR